LQRTLIVPKDNPHAQAQRVGELLSAPQEELARIGIRLQSFATENHSINGLVDKIVKEIVTCI